MTTEYDLWKIFPRMPKKVSIGDITIRDGFQHEEKFISTAAKIFYAEEMALAGCKEIELANLGNPVGMPMFKDAHEIFKYFKQGERFKKRCARKGINPDDIVFTGVTIREPAVDTAIPTNRSAVAFQGERVRPAFTPIPTILATLSMSNPPLGAMVLSGTKRFDPRQCVRKWDFPSIRSLSDILSERPARSKQASRVPP